MGLKLTRPAYLAQCDAARRLLLRVLRPGGKASKSGAAVPPIPAWHWGGHEPK